jgi:superfamily II DNA or RNA helicase
MEQLEECLERIQHMQQLLPGQNDPVTPLVECFRSLTPAWPATDPCVFLETLLQHADGLTSLHADRYPDLIVRLVLCAGLKQEEARRILVQSFRILFPAKGSEPTRASPEHVHMFVNRMLDFRDELELTRAVLSDCLPRVIGFKNSKKVMFKKLVEIAHFTEFGFDPKPGQPELSGTVHDMNEKTRRNAIAAGFETIDAEVDAAFPDFNYAEHYRRRRVVVGLTATQQASFDKPWPAYYALAEPPGASKAADDAPRLLDTLDRDNCEDETSVLKYIPPQLQKFKTESNTDTVLQSFMQAETKHPYNHFVHTTFTFTVEVMEDNDWKEMQDVRDIEPRGVGQWSVSGAYLTCDRDIVYDAGKRSSEWRVQYTMQTSRGVVAANAPVPWEGEVTALGKVRENKPDGCGFIFQLQPTYYFQRKMDEKSTKLSHHPVLSRAPLRVEQPKGLDNTFWSRMVSKTRARGSMQALCLQRKVKPFGALDGGTNCCLRWGMVENISGKKFRPAQTEALNRVFPEDKIISPPNTPEMIEDSPERVRVLRSGTLVLPCGAGKTLIGVCAAMRVQGPVLIVVPNQSLVSQWIRELEYNALVRAGRYGSDADVIVCTQGKLDVNIVKPKKTSKGRTKKRKRSASASSSASAQTDDDSSAQTMKMTRPKTIAADFKMKTTVWDLIIIDESHLSIPINERILGALVYKSAICLSATVLHKQTDKKQLYTRHMPPVIFETTWPVIHSDVILYPVGGGSISSTDIVRRASTFFDGDVFKNTRSNASSAGSKDASNQNMASVSFFATVQNIINHVLDQHHRKVLVFSDVIDIWAACLAYCAQQGNTYPSANGQTSEEERFNMYDAFQTDDKSRVLFVTKIADVGIDLTKCTDVIIIAGSGMTADAQRFGRALRGVENPHAIRRTLHEVYMWNQKGDIDKRLQFLTARGFRPVLSNTLVQKDDTNTDSSQNSPLLPTHAWTVPSASAAAASKSSTSAETASPLLDSHAWAVRA